MKTKGFTLIELLAVIVILAVLALIITPVITNIISTAKEGAFKSSTYGLVDAAKDYCAGEMLKNNGELPSSVTFTVNDEKLTNDRGESLEFNGAVPKGDSWITVTTSCGVILSVTDGNYYATKDADETTVTLSNVENGALTRDQLTEEVNLLKQKDIELQTNIDNLEEKLNSNLSPTGYDFDNMVSLKSYTSATNYYTVPSDGIFTGTSEAINANIQAVQDDGSSVVIGVAASNVNGNSNGTVIQVFKGMKIFQYGYGGSSTRISSCAFIPYKY